MGTNNTQIDLKSKSIWTALRARPLSLTALAIAAAGGMVFAPNAAHAQNVEAESATEESGGLEEIVVTAQKKSEAVNDVGISISAFSADTLADSGVVNTSDLANLVPGFTVADVGFGPPVYTLRGVGFKDTSYNAAGAVGIYVDEAAIAYPIMSIGSVFDLERVEILKGPQGTLFGRNNTGGAVNYIAAKPTENLEGAIRASYGRFDTFDVESYISGPISEDIGVRLAVRTTQSGKGWQVNSVTGDDLGKIDETAVRFTINADFDGKFDALLQLGWWQNQSESAAPQAVGTAFQSPGNTTISNILLPWINAYTPNNSNREAGFSAGQDLSNNMESYQATLRMNAYLSDSVTATSITSLARFEDNGSRRDIGGFATPYNATSAPFVSGYADELDWPWLPNLLVENTAEITTFSQELRFAGEGDKLDWLFGFYYADDRVDSKVNQEVLLTTNTNNFGPGGIFNIRSALQDGVAETRTYGAFANANFALSDTITLNTGLRYSNDKTNYVYCARDSDGIFGPVVFRQPAGGCLTLLASGVRGQFIDSLAEDSISGKVSLDWKPNNDLLVYAGYSRGYKAGSFPNQLAFLGPQVKPATQEKLDSVEAGFKATLAGGDAQLNGAVFYNFYSDKQVIGVVIDPQFGALRRLVNVPKAAVRGVELDLTFNTGEGFYGSLGGAYLDTEITEDFVGPNAFAQQINYGGSKFTETADFQGNIVLGYEVLSGGMRYAIEGDARYSSSVNFDFEPGRVITGVAANSPTSLAPNFSADAFVVANARISVGPEDERWKAQLWVRNLTDEFYVTSVRKALDASVQYTGKPRTYGVTLEFKFF